MTDPQRTEMSKILGDIADESAAARPLQPSPVAAGHAPAGQIEARASQAPSLDLSSLKGKLIRLPLVGRLLRIGMAIIRLPKRLDAISEAISQLTTQSHDLEHKVDAEVKTIENRQSKIERDVGQIGGSLGRAPSDDMVQQYFHALAERFRGPYDQVKGKMAGYLPIIAAESVDFTAYPAVDLACGRCEWADLLRGEGIRCVGVDANDVVLGTARHNGIDVHCGDIFDYLEGLPDASQGIVSGFHIIEHLPTPYKLQLFKEAQRVLVPGGLLILETPNSENPIVSSHYFYLDPSHLNPVPIPALEFMAEHFGFETAAILRHSPMEHDSIMPAQEPTEGNPDGSSGSHGSSADAFLREWVSKEQDYGLVARKKHA